MKKSFVLPVVMLGALLSSCAVATPFPTATPTSSQSPRATSTPAPSDTPTRSPTLTPAPTRTPTATVPPRQMTETAKAAILAPTQTLTAMLVLARRDCQATDGWDMFHYGNELKGLCVRLTDHIYDIEGTTLWVAIGAWVPVETRGMNKGGALRERDPITVYGIVQVSGHTISGEGALEGRNALLGNTLMGIKPYLITGPKGVVWTATDSPW